MINLPNNGDKVRIWPFPGRRVQLDARAVNHEQGGRFADSGQLVIWSDFHLEAYKSGDFCLHPLPGQEDLPEPAPALEEHQPEPEAEPEPLPPAPPVARLKSKKEQG